MSEPEAISFVSCMVQLQKHVSKYTSYDRDHILVLLSRILSGIEGSEIHGENFQKACKESSVLTTAGRLLELDEKMITYLTKELLCKLLDCVPGVFVGSCLINIGIASADSCSRGAQIVLSFVETVYRKMKKKAKEGLIDLHAVYNSIVHMCTDFIVNYSMSYSHHNEEDSKIDGECTDGGSIRFGPQSNGNDIRNLGLENMLCRWDIVLLLLKIVKLQYNTTSTGEVVVTPEQYSQLVQCVRGFVTDLCNGCVVTPRPHLIWRVLTKALEKIVQISSLLVGKHGLVAKTGLHACRELSSMLRTDSLQRRLVFVESGFCGPGRHERTDLAHEMYVVMDCVSGRRLILFLLRVLELRNWSNRTHDDIDLTLSASLHLLNKFPAVKTTESLSVAEQLIHVFCEQDDQLLHMVFILFNIFVNIRKVSSIHHSSINPHIIFNQLLCSISFDETVLLDWLTSSESKVSCSYIKDYLLLLKEDFQGCVSCLHENNPTTHTVGNKRRVSAPFQPKEPKKSLAQDNNTLCELDGSGLEARVGRGLVEYSSSEEEEEEEERGVIEPSNLDRFFSCLIRLNLKLDRLRTLNLVEEEMSVIMSLLDEVERMYEDSL